MREGVQQLVRDVSLPWGLHAMDDGEKKAFECLLRDLDLMGKDGLSFQCFLQGMRRARVGDWEVERGLHSNLWLA